jgi:hypothetical protein
VSRHRAFTVELARRDRSRNPSDIWRWLVGAALNQARRASGETYGARLDRGGQERWALMEFGREVAHAPPCPLDRGDLGAGLTIEIFIRAVRAFCEAGDDGRRAMFAPLLRASAEALDQLMDRAGVPHGRGWPEDAA